MLSRVGLRAAKPISAPLLNTSRLAFARQVSTVKASHDQEQDILVAQRKNRPTSPHLTIYEPQLTMVLSGLHRLTGVFMAFGFYGITCTYAATSLLNIPFDSSYLVAAAAGLPLAVKVAAKAIMAFPFAFHSFNGVRHIVWDFGKELTLKGVYRTGYIVLGLSALAGTYLTFF